MTRAELKQIIKEEINKFGLKSKNIGKNDNNIANYFSQLLYNSLKNRETSDSPLIIIAKWGNELKKTNKFNDDQVEDLKKDALALRGITGDNRYKQVIKDKIVKILKGEKIR